MGGRVSSGGKPLLMQVVLVLSVQSGAPAEFVREQIRKTKELTDKPFGVNIMLMNRKLMQLHSNCG